MYGAICVYQTTKGPIDSIGMYFRCEAEGELNVHGDGTQDVHWKSITEIKALLEADPKQFSEIDIAGILYYIKSI